MGKNAKDGAGTAKIGRPSSYTPEIGARICDGMAGGKSLQEVCREEGMPHPGTVWRWRMEHEAFRENYARAREAQGDHYGRKVAEVAEAVLRGEVVPDVARVAMDGLKWSAARMNRSWGDKQEVEHSGGFEIKVTLND